MSRGGTMRAAMVADDRTIGLRSAPIPECGPGEVRVRIDACGLCGSDLHLYHARSWTPGLIPGHEIAGHVETIGPSPPAVVTERGLEVGRTVVVEPLESCGACPSCRAGRAATCPDLRIAGVHRPGGFAESIVLPASRIHPIAADLDPAVAALAEPLAVGLHAVERGGLARQDRVLILGGGTIGLLAAYAAQRAGAREVVVRARHPHQRALATAVAGADARDADRTIEEDGLASAFDLVVESVGGVSTTLAEATRTAAPGGRVVVLGLFDAAPTFSPWDALEKELSLHWSNCYCQRSGRETAAETDGVETSDFARAARILADSHATLAPLVTHRVELSAVPDAFLTASDKRSGVGKLSVVS